MFEVLDDVPRRLRLLKTLPSVFDVVVESNAGRRCMVLPPSCRQLRRAQNNRDTCRSGADH